MNEREREKEKKRKKKKERMKEKQNRIGGHKRGDNSVRSRQRFKT